MLAPHLVWQKGQYAMDHKQYKNAEDFQDRVLKGQTSPEEEKEGTSKRGEQDAITVKETETGTPAVPLRERKMRDLTIISRESTRLKRNLKNNDRSRRTIRRNTKHLEIRSSPAIFQEGRGFTRN
ncbi:hypothetical protein NDU88_002801 [Pleurodeles waltl]|uniref:Uncharacterized protein n=1 Tax=Pleurodeles waltl TaxID=8319 RepID=A0AAV7TMN6_PLEWA|nr:hypothetical protein NDU88_002801 [Pleurodeles waltl]